MRFDTFFVSIKAVFFTTLIDTALQNKAVSLYLRC
uniref:Uncharacterized protein n=1 Tax=Siphoviridae sp. ctvyM23 TaxID=2826514 RepID=A0A8S5MHM3_9CAUD|nr:MAG TPA: hypothetical protein [Siphoviridae sp. ctvyM23]